MTEAEVRQRLEKQLADDDHAVYVMEVSETEQLAGWVHVHGRHLIESAPFAEIGGLVVDGAHRRRRIGEQLMRQCEAWARNKQYSAVRLRSASHRAEAHEFYKRIGYSNLKQQEVFFLLIDNLDQ